MAPFFPGHGVDTYIQTESTEIINHTALHVVSEMAVRKNNDIAMYVISVHPFYPVRPEKQLPKWSLTDTREADKCA